MENATVGIHKIVVITVVIVLLSGCIGSDEDIDIFDELFGAGEETICDNIDPSTFNKEWDRAHCYKDAAIKQGKKELCEKVDKVGPKTKCYMEIAVKLGQVDICNSLEMYPDANSGAYSKLECWYRVAIKTGDTSICNRIGTNKYSSFTVQISAEKCHEQAANIKKTTTSTVTSTSSTTSTTKTGYSEGGLGQDCYEVIGGSIDDISFECDSPYVCNEKLKCVTITTTSTSTTVSTSSTTITYKEEPCGEIGQPCCIDDLGVEYDIYCYSGNYCNKDMKCEKKIK